jgi:hypothetical protein
MGGVNCGGGVHFERPCHKITDAPDQFVLVDGGCLGANASDLRTMGVQHGGTQQLTCLLSCSGPVKQAGSIGRGSRLTDLTGTRRKAT